MDTSQLKCMIHCDPVLNGQVLGVFAADRLPKGTLSYPYGFIANTDIHSRAGQHWCAFYGDGDGHVGFFDSYGRSSNLNSVYFVRWLNTYAKTREINDKKLQSDNSTLCGLYCILFLRQRFHGHTMQDIVVCLIPRMHARMMNMYTISFQTLILAVYRLIIRYVLGHVYEISM